MRLPRRQEGGGRGRRWKEEARGGPSRRKKTLVRVFNLLVYTRITPPYHRAVSPPLPPSLFPPSPFPLPRRRYFATLRRLLETSRLSCGIAWIKEEERVDCTQVDDRIV